MKKLFLIDGAAGAGKSDLIEFIHSKHTLKANAIAKYTTRHERDVEEALKTDLIYISEEEFSNFIRISKEPNNKFYYYNYGGKRYGFFKKDLDVSIQHHENTFLIVRNNLLINQIIQDYQYIAFTIHIYIYTDRSLVAERLKKDGFSDSVIDFRLKRSESIYNDYLENFDFNMRIIINNSNKVDFHRGINAMINEISRIEDNVNYIYVDPMTRFKLIKPLIGFKQAIRTKIDLYPYEKNVFLMMKFRPNNYEVYEYIKAQLSERGYNCVRADQKEWNITNNTYNPLAVLYCCKYGIALFDEPEEGADFNPNVAYELGIMHYQGKDCLILKNKALNDNIPFDLTKDLHKPYSKEIQIQKILEEWLYGVEQSHSNNDAPLISEV